MSRISQSCLGETPFKRIIGHNPLILECWMNLEKQFFNYPKFDSEFLEQIRRVSAQALKCNY